MFLSYAQIFLTKIKDGCLTLCRVFWGSRTSGFEIFNGNMLDFYFRTPHSVFCWSATESRFPNKMKSGGYQGYHTHNMLTRHFTWGFSFWTSMAVRREIIQVCGPFPQCRFWQGKKYIRIQSLIQLGMRQKTVNSVHELTSDVPQKSSYKFSLMKMTNIVSPLFFSFFFLIPN